MKTTHRSPYSPFLRWLAAAVFLVLGLTRGIAQDTGSAPPQKIGAISIRFVGTANVSDQLVRANMQLRAGMDVDETLIDRDIRTLYKTGLFEFIEVKRDNLPNGTVGLIFELTPRYRVLAIRYEGAKQIKPSKLEKKVKTKINYSLDERQVKDDTEAIRKFYQKKGYYEAQVTYVIERNRDTGFCTVVFEIKEGAKVKVSDIRFTGNRHFTDRKLRDQMETKRWWMFSWLLGTGRLKDEVFQDDLDKLKDFYREEGFLDVDISFDQVRFDYPKPGHLVITIPINEGRQYHIGTITFSGNKLYPSSLLYRILHQKTGAVFAPSKLDKDTELLEDFYGRDGYLDTRVRLLRRPNIETGNIDIEYKIEESEKFHVESINIEGNVKTKSTVIVRELTLGPGEVFNTVRMKISKLRLENTRFFDDVNLSPEDTNIPGRRNLKVDVKEGRTGNLSFGAGFSTLEKATVFAEISQSNFDLFSPHTFFQGGGQKFRLRMQLGSYSSEVVLSFEEPWLFQRELALGFSVYRTSADYYSSYYQEITTGFEVYLRKRLFELVEGRVSYGIDRYSITNVSASAPAVIKASAGSTDIAKFGLQLLRDTRDKIINTTQGSRIEGDFELAGPFGGNTNYYRLEFRDAHYFPLFQTQNQVLALLTRGGVVENYGGTPDVPFFVKNFLGGPYTLRGFEYRDVGPKDPTTHEPLGGKTYGFFSAEYTVDIVSPIRFAVFYDAGFVNSGAYDFNPGNYNDNWGIGLRLFVAGSPLALDFGIPLTHDRYNNKGNQFNFSFGTRY